MKIKIRGVTEGLVRETYFHGLIPREDLPDLMKNQGDFLLRITEPEKGMDQHVVLSVFWNKELGVAKGMKHYVIREENGRFFIEKLSYDSIQAMIYEYQKNNIGIDKEDLVKIKNAVERQKWELLHSTVLIGEKLGEGAYGEVCKGTVNGQPVAIKMNHMNNLTKDQIKEVMSEARNMRRLDHKNIIQLIGIAAFDEPLLIVMELASDGSLDSYLKKHGPSMTDKKKAIICQQISWALSFIKTKNILHRDLAARNCLYHHDIVKLSDFGKSQPGPTYKMDPTERLPIRWLSPESIQFHVYDFASEVWSFGITCWEIYSNGAEPYPNMKVAEVSEALGKGQGYLRMPDSTNSSVQALVNFKILIEAGNRFPIESIVTELAKYTGVHELESHTSKSKPKSKRSNKSNTSPKKAKGKYSHKSTTSHKKAKKSTNSKPKGSKKHVK